VAYTPKGAWSSATTYAQGDEVTSGSSLYISLAAGNLNHTPSSSPTWWQNVGGAQQTPWLSDIDATGNYSLLNVKAIGIGIASSAIPLQMAAGTLGGTAGNTLPLSRFSFVADNSVMLNATARRTATGTGWTSAAIRLQHRVDTTDMPYVEFNPDGSDQQALSFGCGSSEWVRLQSNGQLKILQGPVLISAAAPRLFFNVAGHTPTMQVYIDGSDKMVINNDTVATQVGIGKAASYALDVNGDVNLSSGGAYRVNGVAIGSGVTTQGNVTASRALGTVYQNTGTKPIFATVTISANVPVTLSAYCDTASSPTTVVCVASTTGAWIVNLHFIVLPNYYYKVATSGGSPTISTWFEWS
jgi:hypothetical protein